MKLVRSALVGATVALAAGGGALVAWLGADGRLGYTEPGGNPTAETETASGFALAPVAERRTLPGFTFAGSDGRPLRLADLSGKVMLVNLWATWCPPCIAEMPALDAVEQRLGGKRFQVVAVSLDRGGLDRVKAWFDRNDIRALEPYAADPDQFGNAVLPTSLLVDARGRVAWHGAGLRDWTGAEAEAAIQTLLTE